MTGQQILTDARTVSHVADHFQRLKQVAERLDPDHEIVTQGYFNPSQEERTRHLQASYWQARCALLELIESIRKQTPEEDQSYGAAFYVAYAAALVLVDAARFLRDHFHSFAVVRHKLNEPDASLGIPAGMYDQVQRSMTSPRNAWYLYHAIQYYDTHQEQLRRLSAHPEFVKLAEIVDRLDERIRIRASRYARTSLRVRGRKVATRIGKRGFGRVVYQLQKLVSSAMADRYLRHGHSPHLPAEIHARVVELLMPGDVLIVRKEHAVTNYFLPGYWPHAALYLGSRDQLAGLEVQELEQIVERMHARSASLKDSCCVLEAMKDGVHLRPVDSPLASDSVVVLRPKLSPELLANALVRVLAHEGKPYDFDFDFNRSDRLVCTEVVYRAYDGVGELSLPLKRRAGRNTLSASDLIQIAIEKQTLQPVAVYSPEHASDILVGEQMLRVLRSPHETKAI